MEPSPENTLDNFFQPLNTIQGETLVDVFNQGKTFDEILETRIKMRDILIEVNETTKEHIEDDEISNLLSQLESAKSSLKDNIVEFNKIKDEISQLESLKELCFTLQNDVSRKVDHIDDIINSNEILTKGEQLKNLMMEYNDCTKQFLDEKIEVKAIDLKTCKKEIKKLGFLYSFQKNKSIGYPCPVCLSAEVTQFCDPCGHTYCNTCLRSTYCYICRLKIEKKHKIFFS